MKNNLLYIGNRIKKASSGADHVNKRNQECLESICSVTYVPNVEGRFSKLYLSVTDNYLKTIEKELSKGIYNYVFVPQSLLGRVCCFVKNKAPKVKIIVFFHNVEIQYATEYLKTKGIKALPFYLFVRYWEKVCCRFSDYYITLNSRDSNLLYKIYKKETNLELPTSFQDKVNDEIVKTIYEETTSEIIDVLFVGVSFFANVQGVQWFINNVMPKINGHFHIVGKGMDKIKFENLTDRIHIHGFVDELSDFYYRARMVVSPIHVGGGMKTKTAEALMYGKTILGTNEAFEGYKINERCTILCNTAEDYIKEINNRIHEKHLYNPFARELFLNNYSDEIIKQKLSDFWVSI